MAAGLLAHEILGSQRALVDYLTMIEGPDKPFLAICKKGPKVDNLLYEWPADKYQDAEDNAVVDGKDISGFSNADEDYQVLSNRVQWIRDQAMVGKLAQEVQNQAGVPNKKAWAIQKKLERLWRNIEAAFCSDNDLQVGSGSVPNKLRGLGSWLTSAQTAVPAAYRTQAASMHTGAISALTEAVVQGLLQSLWTESGRIKTYTLICGPTLKRAFTDFTRTNTGAANVQLAYQVYNQEMKSRAILASIDSYEGDFGRLELVPTQWNAKFTSAAANLRRGYILDPSLTDCPWMQGPKVTPLEDLGGGPRFFVDAIAALRVYMPRVMGAITSTS